MGPLSLSWLPEERSGCLSHIDKWEPGTRYQSLNRFELRYATSEVRHHHQHSHWCYYCNYHYDLCCCCYYYYYSTTAVTTILTIISICTPLSRYSMCIVTRLYYVREVSLQRKEILRFLLAILSFLYDLHLSWRLSRRKEWHAYFLSYSRLYWAYVFKSV